MYIIKEELYICHKCLPKLIEQKVDPNWWLMAGGWNFEQTSSRMAPGQVLETLEQADSKMQGQYSPNPEGHIGLRLLLSLVPCFMN